MSSPPPFPAPRRAPRQTRVASQPPRLPALSDFAGTWEVRRKIVDHLSASTACFRGRATITPTRFEEKGKLTLGAAVLDATRAYRLRFTARTVIATHPDGAEFIVLHQQPAQTVRHPCGADLYVGRFFFIDIDTWAEAWRVVGPRKHYVSLAHYRRLQR